MTPYNLGAPPHEVSSALDGALNVQRARRPQGLPGVPSPEESLGRTSEDSRKQWYKNATALQGYVPPEGLLYAASQPGKPGPDCRVRQLLNIATALIPRRRNRVPTNRLG